MAGRVFDAFAAAARAAPSHPFLVVPPGAAAGYAPAGVTLSYAGLLARIEACRERYARAGYGHGHRVAILLENRPDYFIHWLALNALGVSVVPINPYYQVDETAHLLAHSDSVLAVSIAERAADVAAAARRGARVPVVDAGAGEFPAPPPAPRAGRPGPDSECGLLYTSGTTGRPKGCMLTNAYFTGLGRWYLDQGPMARVRPGEDRLLTPLPMFHINAMACSSTAMMMSRNTVVQLDRFHPARFWADVRGTAATIIHYLGVMPAILMGLPARGDDGDNAVRFGFGANLDPAQHEAFEARFGFPLIEAWAMTETGAGAALSADREPRHVGTRNFGRPRTCDVRILDDAGAECAPGAPGRFLVRNSAAAPRRGFFAGYYKDEAATEASWQGGWFHTGDIVTRTADGSLEFVDRAKNIIRRSGENIAALEVETVLTAHDAVAEVAVIAVPDALRDEEVMAFVVPPPGRAITRETAEDLLAWCRARLAYYKAPGYVMFVDALPVTATNKVRKVTLAEAGGDPRGRAGCHDLRGLKRP